MVMTETLMLKRLCFIGRCYLKQQRFNILWQLSLNAYHCAFCSEHWCYNTNKFFSC
jgi:hypothetical protein